MAEVFLGNIKGEPGKDGYTPVKGVDYFDGADGYTPVKGVDYFDGADGKDGENGKDYVLTDADKQKIAEMALEIASIVYVGSAAPTSDLGKDGDIYIVSG